LPSHLEETTVPHAGGVDDENRTSNCETLAPIDDAPELSNSSKAISANLRANFGSGNIHAVFASRDITSTTKSDRDNP
jgi:hypothetical protein